MSITSELSHTSEEPPVVLVLSVELEDGRSEDLTFRYGDDAWAVVQGFVATHSIPPAAAGAIVGHMLAALAERSTEDDRPTDSPTNAWAVSQPPQPRDRDAVASSISSVSDPPLSPLSSPSRPRPRPPRAPSPVFVRRSYRSASAPGPRRPQRPRRPPNPHTHHPLIDPKSREIADFGSGKPFDSVFHKLHHQGVSARRRRLELSESARQQHAEKCRTLARPKISLSATAQRLVKNRGKAMLTAECPNYGALLYKESLRRGQERLTDLATMRDKEAAAALEGATWRPEITAKAKGLSARLPGGVPRYLRPRQPARDLPRPQEFPYAPEVDRRSRSLARGRHPGAPVHESLFLEAEQRRWRSEDRRLQCELLEHQRLYTAWQQLTLSSGGQGVDGSDNSLAFTSLLDAQGDPSVGLVSRPPAARSFHCSGHTARVLDAHLTAASQKEGRGLEPSSRVPQLLQYKYDNPSTAINKLYHLKSSYKP